MKNKSLLIVCAAAAAIFVIGIGLAVLVPDKPIIGKKPEIVPEVDYTIVDGHIDAIMRGWAVTDVCYDKANNTYLFKVFDHKPVAGYSNAGWYMMMSYKFVKFDNGTYALTQSNDSEQFFPDVTGLHCKTQPASPDWGKNWVPKE